MAEKMSTSILMIDDDPALTELTGIMLHLHGYTVLTTNHGTQAVRMIKENLPSLVLLDLMMPDMDGWQICRAIRQFSNIPILVISAIADPAVVAGILDAGADDFLRKPYPPDTLLAHLRKMIRQLDAAQLNKKPDLSGKQPTLSGF